MNYEILDNNGVVINTIIATEEFVSENYTNYRLVSETEPEIPVVPQEYKITRLAFLNRFQDSEAIAIDLASIGSTPEAAAVRLYLKKVDAATYIDLQDQKTRDGVIALESLGLLQAGRALEILDTPIQPSERP